MDDILICGMEMPTRQILAVINPNGLVEALAGNTLVAEYEAVPVPPHGRLGDLGRIERALHEWESVVWDRNALQMLRDCINLVKAAPTVIPASEEYER